MRNEINIPILYLYIYRNIKESNKNKIYLTNKDISISINNIIRKVPAKLRQEICDEMEIYKLLKKINREKYLIITNKTIERNLRKLKEYIFPFTT